MERVNTICSCIVAVATSLTALGVLFAAWELEESKNATKARITLDYELAGIQLGNDFLSNEHTVIAMRDGGSAVPEDVQHEVIADFLSYLAWYQLGYVQWRDRYISDRHWEPLRREMCWLRDANGSRDILALIEPSRAREIFDGEFYGVVQKCLDDPGAFASENSGQNGT